VLISASGCTGSGNSSQDLEDYPPVIQELAGEFELDPDKVLDILEQAREYAAEDMGMRFMENQARAGEAMRPGFEERLEKAVEDEEITSGQMEEILAKKAEIAQSFEELGDLPPEERRESVQELRDGIKDWAENNDIDLHFFMEPKQSRFGRSPFPFQKDRGNPAMSFQEDISR